MIATLTGAALAVFAFHFGAVRERRRHWRLARRRALHSIAAGGR